MGAFTGTLNPNEIFAALFNMIISQRVFADLISGTTSKLVDRSRVDGGLYGDTKLYYSTDVLSSTEWGNDAEASNLLNLYRPEAPKCQKITLDKFRQISLTVDYYLSKRAWANEGAFADFTAVMLGWISDTKRVYDATLYNTYIGTTASDLQEQTLTITLPEDANAEAQARLRGAYIGEFLANLIDELEAPTRKYNDYGQLRSYDIGTLDFIWNSKWVNKIEKRDLPTVFHKEDLINKLGQNTLPYWYFGDVNTAAGTTDASSNTTIRSLIEKDYNTVSPSAQGYVPSNHIFPGDLLPKNTAYGANETYTVNDKILVKILHNRSVPFMSAFEVGTSFFNPKSLTETHYLTWGHNTLEYLKRYPFITIKSTN